jgi:HAE1 family hydrophobic/amphiphilic exporter-1
MGTLFFFASLGIMALVPTSFVPPDDFSFSTLSIELPPGGTLADTDRVSAAAAAIVRSSPAVRNVVEFVGSDNGEVRKAELDIRLVPRSQRSLSQ